MRVIVTRADNEQARVGKLLRDIGCTPIPAPMTEITHNEEPFDISPFQAVITTSANGLRSLAAVTENRDVLVYVVGPASKRLAESLGFKNVQASAGSGKQLVGYIKRTAPRDLVMIYFRGDMIQVPVGKELAKLGYKVASRVAYRTTVTKEFSDEVKAAFNEETPPEVALFMSIRNVRLFSNCLEASGLSDKVRQMTAVTISPAVSDFARELPWKSVVSADEPDGRAVVAAIERLKADAS